MKNKILFLFLLYLCAVPLYAQRFPLGAGERFTDEKAVLWAVDLAVFNQLPEFLRYFRVYPEKFASVDPVSVFYEAGNRLYADKRMMLSLKCYLQGFQWFSTNSVRADCGYSAARILYQLGNRESALYYVNRSLELTVPSSELNKKLKQLKRRVRWEYLSTYEGLPDSSVSAISFDGDDIWFGLWTDGVARYTRSRNSLWIVPTAQVSKHVRDIAVDRDYVWVGTYDGLYRFNKHNSTWGLFQKGLGRPVVKRIRLTPSGTWVATLNRGLFFIDRTSDRIYPVLPASYKITDILDTPNGLFVATLNHGMLRVSGGKKLEILSGEAFKCLLEVNGHIWGGTYGGGIYVVNSEGQLVRHLGVEDGLPSDFVEALSRGGGKILIGTLDGGLGVMSEAGGPIRKIGILDGLPSGDVTRIAVEKNRIWCGTLSGGIGILLTEDWQDF